MKKTKKSWTTIRFDEDEILNAVYQRAHHNNLRPQGHQIPQEERMNKRIWKGLASLAFGLVVLVGLVMMQNNTTTTVDVNQETQEVSQTIMAYIAIDINPSFELGVLDDGSVSTITALNEDAESLDTTSLIGLPSDEVIEAIVLMATEAGFIDTTDATEDYVVVTTVIADETTLLTQEYLMTQLQTRIQENTELQSYHFVELKSDMVTKLEAEGKEVPLGLYVINGTIETEDGTYLSAKEFFSNSDNLEMLQSKLRVTITALSQEQLTIMINAWLRILADQGIDVTAYQTQMETANYDQLLLIHDELKTLYPNLIPSQSGPNESAPQSPNENAQGSSENSPEVKPNEPAQDGSGTELNPNESAPESTGTPSENSKKPSDKGKNS